MREIARILIRWIYVKHFKADSLGETFGKNHAYQGIQNSGVVYVGTMQPCVRRLLSKC